eukprot:6477032-Amphidinium_carterae.1
MSWWLYSRACFLPALMFSLSAAAFPRPVTAGVILTTEEDHPLNSRSVLQVLEFVLPRSELRPPLLDGHGKKLGVAARSRKLDLSKWLLENVGHYHNTLLAALQFSTDFYHSQFSGIGSVHLLASA